MFLYWIAMMYPHHCRSIAELSGWVEENGTYISFWLSQGKTSCLRPYFEYKLTPLHLILLLLKLMGDYLSRKADSRTGNLGGYIQLKRVQYRVSPCSSIKHCKRDLPYHSAADLRKSLMKLCYFLNLQKQHTLYFGQTSSGTAPLLCRCSVIVLMASSGKFHPPPALPKGSSEEEKISPVMMVVLSQWNNNKQGNLSSSVVHFFFIYI